MGAGGGGFGEEMKRKKGGRMTEEKNPSSDVTSS